MASRLTYSGLVVLLVLVLLAVPAIHAQQPAPETVTGTMPPAAAVPSSGPHPESGGLLYKTSLDIGDLGFSVYDPATDTWSPLTPYETGAQMAVSANGMLYAYGHDTATIDVYHPLSDSWTPVLPAPPGSSGHQGNLEITNAGEFLYTEFGAATLWYTSGGGWNTFPLPFTGNAMGDYDPSSDQYVIGQFFTTNAHRIDLHTWTITDYSSPVGNGENARFGVVMDNRYFFEADGSAIHYFNLGTPAAPPVSTGVVLGWYSSAAADRANHLIYVASLNGQLLWAYDAVANSSVPLTGGSYSYHSSLAFVAPPGPDIEVTPGSLSEEHCSGWVTERTLRICNVGGSPLELGAGRPFFRGAAVRSRPSPGVDAGAAADVARPSLSASAAAPARPLRPAAPFAAQDVASPGLTTSSPAVTPEQVPPAAHPEAVLWDQPLSNVSQAAYVDQQMPDFPTYSSYLADDFTNGQDWAISTIFIPGDGWNGFSTLFNATELTWQLYHDNGGVPAGDPSGGGDPPDWSLTLSPADPLVTITAGTPGGMPSNVSLSFPSPLMVPPGHWWLVFYPTMSFGSYGQYGRQASDTANGNVGQFINPGGAFGFGTAWVPWTVLGPAEQDIAFRLEGEIAGPQALVWSLAEVTPPKGTQGVLYDNGPLVTHPGACSGMDASRLQGALGMTTYGFGHQFLVGNRMADDFTILDPAGWDIQQITFFAYQTNAPPSPSPITGVYYQVWDGPPDDPGSSVVFGDLVTNRLLVSTFANIQRDWDSSTCANNRYLFADIASAGFLLTPGTYWLDWTTNGSLPSGPWAPPITIVGQSTTGNALQYLGSTGLWGAAMDVGQQGMPFVIEGQVAGPVDYPWLSENPTSGALLPGECADVTVTFDSTGLPGGSTFGALRIQSNDPDEPVVTIPVELGVVACERRYLPLALRKAH